MQTFLPYPDFGQTVACLDNRRLGKQRVEAFQIYKVLAGLPAKSGKPYRGWTNHPAVLMWRGYEDSLISYYNSCLTEWIKRGFNNNMQFMTATSEKCPNWLGNEKFHSAHRSNLLRKNPEHYGKFGWTEPDDLPYIWPKGN